MSFFFDTPNHMKKQTNNIVIEVPLQPHLAKFWRVFHPEPVQFIANDDYGHILKNLMSLSNSRSNALRHRNHAHKYPQNPNNILTCIVSNSQYVRWRLKGGIRAGSVAAINNWVDGKFDAAFLTEVALLRQKGHNIKLSIELFCEKYGLSEDDILYETLKKKEYRHRLTQLYHANNPTRQHP